MFEAREFLRKKLIGQNVQITVDYIQPASNDFPEKTCCTVTIGMHYNVAYSNYNQDTTIRNDVLITFLKIQLTFVIKQVVLMLPKH